MGTPVPSYPSPTRRRIPAVHLQTPHHTLRAYTTGAGTGPRTDSPLSTQPGISMSHPSNRLIYLQAQAMLEPGIPSPVYQVAPPNTSGSHYPGSSYPGQSYPGQQGTGILGMPSPGNISPSYGSPQPNFPGTGPGFPSQGGGGFPDPQYDYGSGSGSGYGRGTYQPEY